MPIRQKAHTGIASFDTISFRFMHGLVEGPLAIMIDRLSKDWGRHPLVVLILVLAACAAIVTFLTGRSDLPSFFPGHLSSPESKNQDNTGPRTSASPSDTNNRQDAQPAKQISQLESERNQLHRTASSPPTDQPAAPQFKGSPTNAGVPGNVEDNGAKPESILPLPDSFEPLEAVNIYGHNGPFGVVVGKVCPYKCKVRPQIIACYVLTTQTHNGNIDWSVKADPSTKLIDNLNVEHEEVREYFTNARNQELKTFNLGKGDSHGS